MKASLNNFLKKIHFRLPLWLSYFYMPIVNFIRDLQTFYLHIYLIEGEEKESGTILKIAYVGEDPRIQNYWTMRLFRRNPVITKKSRIVVWKIDRYCKHNINKIDLIIVEITRLTKPFVSSGKGFILPRWFDTLIDVKDSFNAINKRNDTHKQIKRFGFTFEERFSYDDLKYFYERMYKPYTLGRHRESSVRIDYSYFLKRFRKNDSRLFFLMKDNEPVSGSFNERRNGMIKFSGLGILDGRREILSMGAIRALYYFMLDHYNKKNIRLINFGGTSPLLSDGLTLFKLSMHAIPSRKKLLGEKSLWLVPLNETSALKMALKSNPFIHIVQNKIYRAMFLDSSEINNKHEFLKLIKRTWFKKLDGTNVYCWNDTQKISQWISDEQLSNHEVVEFEVDSSLV